MISVRSDIDRNQKLSRGDLDELFHPDSASSSKPKFVQKTGSPKGEVDKKQKRPGLKKFEVGPPAAKRHVGKQKPVVVDDGSSKRKKVVVSYPPEEDELDRLVKELDLPTYLKMKMNLKSSIPNLLPHVHVVSKIQKVRFRN